MARQPSIIWIRGAGATAAFASLESPGFIVLPARPDEAVRQVAELRPNAVVFEESPLSAKGFLACERVVSVTSAPVLVMSETADEDAIVRAFAAGATDYVVLPQHGDLLAARLRAALRLTGAAISDEEPESLTVGEISLYPREGWAEHRGERLNLTPTEFSLLLALGRAGGQPVPHRTLIATVWGPEYVDCRNYLRLYIRYLRGKIEDDPDAPAVVMNEWGVGYFLSNGVREPGAAK